MAAQIALITIPLSSKVITKDVLHQIAGKLPQFKVTDQVTLREELEKYLQANRIGLCRNGLLQLLLVECDTFKIFATVDLQPPQDTGIRLSESESPTSPDTPSHSVIQSDSYKLLCWNINGKASSKSRLKVVNECLGSHQDLDIIFLQEVGYEIKSLPKKIQIFDSLRFAISHEAMVKEPRTYTCCNYIIYNKEKFKGTPIDEQSLKLCYKAIPDKLKPLKKGKKGKKGKKHKTISLREFVEEEKRICLLVLEDKSISHKTFIAASLHNFYRTKYEPSEMIELICKFLSKLAKITGRAVLLVGDFNTDILQQKVFKTITKLKFNIADYEATDYRKAIKPPKIDFILFRQERGTKIVLSDVKAQLAINPKLFESKAQEYIALLVHEVSNHDPLTASFQVRNSTAQ